MINSEDNEPQALLREGQGAKAFKDVTSPDPIFVVEDSEIDSTTLNHGKIKSECGPEEKLAQVRETEEASDQIPKMPLAYQACSFEDYINPSSLSHSTTTQRSAFDQSRTVPPFFTKRRIAAVSIGLLTALVSLFLIRDSVKIDLSKFIEIAIVLTIACMHVLTFGWLRMTRQKMRPPRIAAGILARRRSPAANLSLGIVLILGLVVFGGAANLFAAAMEGSIAYDGGKYAEAADKFSTVINVLGTGYYYQQRGNSYFRNGEYKKAVKDYTEALKKPTIGLYYARANSYEKLGEHALAANDFRQGNKLAKRLGNTVAAQSLLDGDQLEDAYKLYSVMIKESPNSAKLLAARGHCLTLMHRYQDAVRDYTTAIAHDHDFGQAYYGRGTAYGYLNKESLAEEDFARAKKFGYERD